MTIKKLSGLVLHVLLSALLAAGTAFVVHGVVNHTQRTAQIDQAEAYIQARARNEQALFEDARTLMRTASRVFRQRLAYLEDDQIDRDFDRYFPVRTDGTRRSAAELWDGLVLPGGDVVEGVGAFLAEGATMSREEKRRYLAGFHTARTVGNAHLSEFSSLYFFTPDRRMVMFAPHRQDDLRFYRYDASADFPLEADEDHILFDSHANPANEMMCTHLSRFVYEDGGERVASACRMPIRQNGQLLGAFGTSIMMNDYLANALAQAPAHGMNMLFDRNGNIITRGDQMKVGQESSARMPHLEPVAVMAQIDRDPREMGVIRAEGSSHIVAFARIIGPDWIFASVIDMSGSRAIADAWACFLFVFVFVASLFITVLRGVISRLRPVRRLVRMRRRGALDPAIQLGVQHTSL